MLRTLLAAAFVLLMPVAAAAQGRVTGTVKDGAGHPIKGATVTAENSNFAPRTLTSTSDARGRFAFLGLRGGTWTFKVDAPGFVSQTRQYTTHMMGTNPPMEFELDPRTELPPPGPLANLNTATLQERLAKAAALEQSGAVDEAIGAYREILEHVPGLTSVHLQLGVLFERKGDTASAVAEYQAALKGDPASARARAALDRLARR